MIKAAIRLLQIVMGLQNIAHRLELLLVTCTILLDVGFILPGQSAGMLLVCAHCAAMVGPILQEFFDYIGVASDKAAAQPREVRALG
mgnify:CR=1 FL=1